MALNQALKRAGWDPFNRSAECRAIMSRPDIRERRPGTIRAIDVLGIHWYIATLELFRKFGDAPGVDTFGVDGQAFFEMAVLFVLTDPAVTIPGGLTPEVELRARDRIGRWYSEVFVPAGRRMHAASFEEIVEDPDAFEPALTGALLFDERGFSDIAADQANAARGMRMHEDNALTPREGPPLSLEALDEMFTWVSRNGRRILEIRKGSIMLDAKRMKTALDGLIGRRDDDQEERCAPLASEPASSGPDPLEMLARSHDSAAAAVILRGRLDRVPASSANALVLSNLLAVLRGESPSLRELARAGGFDHTHLSRIQRQEVEAVLREMGEAG